MRPYYSIFLLIFFLLAGFATIGDEPERGLINLDEAIRAASALTLTNHPDADDVVVDEHTRIVYQTNGEYTAWSDSVVKILTERGLRDNRTISMHFLLPYGEARLARLEVIKPDGRIVPVNLAEQGRVMINPGQMGANIYNPNDKIYQVGVPDMDVGDLCRSISVYTGHKSVFPGSWSDLETFEGTSPICRGFYEVTGPSSLPLLRIAFKDPVAGTMTNGVEERDGMTRHWWSLRDVPRMFPEPAMPSAYTVVQRLVLSTIADWADVSKWYWRISLPHLEAVTPEMKAGVEELTAGVMDKGLKIEAIFRYVSQKIRYMGLTTETEAPGFEPHDVRITFENQYGVCRDKAALLVAMLRIAGLDAYPVLIHVGPKKDIEAPQPYFNHAIVCVTGEDGPILMDPTNENTKELLPAYLCNCSYLIARPEGDTLRVSPPIPADVNLMRISTRGCFDENGRLRAESELSFNGINDSAYRNHLARLKPEDRRRFFEATLRNMMPGVELESLEIRPDPIRDTTMPLSVRLTYSAIDVLVPGATETLVPLPRLGSSIGMVSRVLGRTGLEKRKYPLLTDIACAVEETFELTFSNGLAAAISLPAPEPVHSELLDWSQSVSLANGCLTGTNRFAIKAVEFSPADYLALRDQLKVIERGSRIMPIFATPSEAGLTNRNDKLILDTATDILLEGDGSWMSVGTMRQKILTYNGAKQNAELQFDFNPAWESLELMRAIVITPDGRQTNAIRTEEVNIMDEGWCASAPRYPPGRILTVALPRVEPGSVIEYTVQVAASNRPFFSYRRAFRDSSPALKRRVRLVAKELPFIHVSDPDGMLIERRFEDAARQGREWEVFNAAPIRQEEDMPPNWALAPAVFVSTGDWKTYALAAHAALVQVATNQAAALSKAGELVCGMAGDREKILAIRDFVARNIRLAGPGGFNELPWSCLTPADRTLEDGYGNITDRAILLYAMLDAAALKPDFVLASDAPRLERLSRELLRAPQLDTFDWLMVRVRIDGEWVYLNDTDQYAALGTTDHDGMLALALETAAIEPMLLATNLMNRFDARFKLDISTNGAASMSRTVFYYGSAYEGFHRKFAEIRPEERSRYHQEKVGEMSRAARQDGEFVTDYASYPGRETFSVNIPDYAVCDGPRLYFQLPGSLGGIFDYDSYTRENPVYLDQRIRSRIEYEIKVPTGYRPLILPRNIAWIAPQKGGFVRVTCEWSDSARTLSVIRDAALEPLWLGAETYPELLWLGRRLAVPAAHTFLFTREPAGP